jgi:hypothetical protein
MLNWSLLGHISDKFGFNYYFFTPFQCFIKSYFSFSDYVALILKKIYLINLVSHITSHFYKTGLNIFRKLSTVYTFKIILSGIWQKVRQNLSSYRFRGLQFLGYEKAFTSLLKVSYKSIIKKNLLDT